MKIGILGGTFDPVHKGHMSMARAAYKELELDRVLLIPAGNPYFKGKITPYEIRCGMVEAAIRDEISGDGAEVTKTGCPYELSRIESDPDKPTYTYLTLKRLNEIYKDSRLYFICGTDVFEDISKWMHPEEVLKEAALAVFGRTEDEAGAGTCDAGVINGEKSVHRIPDRQADPEMIRTIYPEAECVFMKTRIPAVSSTLIRERIAAGLPADDLVSPGVYDYIKEKGLYVRKD